jgi:hypothetical protein
MKHPYLHLLSIMQKTTVRAIAGIMVLAFSSSLVLSQDSLWWQQWYGERKFLSDLLNDGYEIKASIRLGDADMLYVQKGGSAYRCLAHAVGSTVRLQTNTLNLIACLSKSPNWIVSRVPCQHTNSRPLLSLSESLQRSRANTRTLVLYCHCRSPYNGHSLLLAFATFQDLLGQL